MGRLIRPVREPHKVTSPYGWRTLYGRTQFHDGIDYVNKVDCRDVIAIADGVVCYDKDNYNDVKRWISADDSAGNFIILKQEIHEEDYFVRYLHLVKNYVAINQQMKQGDIIGEYGDVGYSFGAHLHIDFYTLKWVKIDPTPILLKGLAENGLV